MKYYLMFFFLLFSCVRDTYGQEHKTISSVAELADSITAMMKARHISGLMLVLATRDSTLFAGGLGHSNEKESIPVTSRHLFRMGSITKMFTALGILQLVSEGRLSLNDTLSRIAPEISFQNPWEKTNPVKVIHLLEHTAGFDDMHPNAMYNFSGTDLRGLAEVRRFQKSLHSRWKPGERFSYSNPGYTLLAYLIEKFSGQKWERYLTEKILLPVGMSSSNFNYRPGDTGQYVQGYTWDGRHNQKILFTPIYGGAAGSFNSCASDMARYIRFYLHNWKINGQQFLSPQVLSDMETPHSTLAAAKGLKTGYGSANSGWALSEKFMFHGHTGSIAGFESSFMYNRDLGVGYALSANSGFDLGAIDAVIRDFLTRSFTNKTQAPAALDKNSLEPFTGYYQLRNPREELGGYFEEIMGNAELRLDKNVLQLHSDGQVRILEPVNKMIFRYQGENYPQTLLTTDSDNNRVLVDGGNYYRQVSWCQANLPSIFLFSGISIMATSLMAIVFLLLKFARTKTWQGNAGLLIFPATGTACLFAALACAGRITKHFHESIGPDFNTVVIFTGTLVFPLCMLFGLIAVIMRWRKIQSKWLKGYFLLLILSGSYLTVLMFITGLTGVRVWAY